MELRLIFCCLQHEFSTVAKLIQINQRNDLCNTQCKGNFAVNQNDN